LVASFAGRLPPFPKDVWPLIYFEFRARNKTPKNSLSRQTNKYFVKKQGCFFQIRKKQRLFAEFEKKTKPFLIFLLKKIKLFTINVNCVPIKTNFFSL